MKKKHLLLLIILGLFSVAYAQEEKLRVAILDPTTSGMGMDNGTKLAVQELISAAFVSTGRFIIIERSMIDKIIKEQAFQNSDVADNSQATEIGKLAGANKVVLSAVSMVGGRNMLSIKMIDVMTASIDQQKTKIVGTNDLLDVVEPLTMELLGEEANYVKQNTFFKNLFNKKARDEEANNVYVKQNTLFLQDETNSSRVKEQIQSKSEQVNNHSIQNNQDIIHIPNMNFYVSKQDELGFFTWVDAINICAQRGEGWRLPTIGELQKMAIFKEEIGNLNGYNNRFRYWSSEEKNRRDAYYFDIKNMEKDDDDKSDADKCVRCVKSK